MHTVNWPDGSGAPLSPRERQVLQLVADGHAPKAIAHRLRLSPETVKDHLAAAYRKLGARNRSHAIALAYAKGIVR